MQKIDAGQRFGRWTALEPAGKNKFGRDIWTCRCECGKIGHPEVRNLLRGASQSCGCLAREKIHNTTFKDMSGQRFGRLVVTNQHTYDSKLEQTKWMCRCDCGNTIMVARSDLISKRTVSCGCYQRDQKTLHGESRSRLHRVWTGMLTRTTNPNVPYYKNYGGRGITVCDEWKDFANFRDWALANGYDQHAPKGQCTIDRINNNKGYSPENCRWVSMAVQATNKRPRKRKENEDVKGGAE